MTRAAGTAPRAAGVASRGRAASPPLDPARARGRNTGNRPRPYQVEGTRWLQGLRRGILADEMALGKTAQALLALPRHARGLVVCPAAVQDQWAEEIADWRPDLRPTLNESLRRPHESEALIVTWALLPDPPRFCPGLVADDLSDVHCIADEIQYAKNDDADRTRRFRRLESQVGWLWSLTGTPQEGWPDQLYGVCVSAGLARLFADPDGILSAREHFVKLCGGRERWVWDKKLRAKRRAGYEWGEVSARVHEILRLGMLRRRADDHLDLPPYRVVDVPVPVSDDLREYLDEVSDTWRALAPGPGELPPFELFSSATAALARSRARLDERGNPVGPAVEYVRDMAESFPVIAFSAHVDPLAAISKLPGAALYVGETGESDRRAALAAFRGGRARILAMSIGAGGVGLNLEQAGGVVFLDRAWNPTQNLQAIYRARRPGQRHASIAVVRFVSRHPLDERIRELLDDKERTEAAAVDGKGAAP